MELKPKIHRNLCRHSNVLIVPSGIETQQKQLQSTKFQVLIVPSGIETPETTSRVRLRTVLIVPSGIETLQPHIRRFCGRSINCT